MDEKLRPLTQVKELHIFDIGFKKPIWPFHGSVLTQVLTKGHKGGEEERQKIVGA